MEDKIFLLSINEYKRYKDRIPHINCWWWLRSPGHDSSTAADVRFEGESCKYGSMVHCDYGAVRPALVIPNGYEIGTRILAYDFPWIVIDDELAIAEVPIMFQRFDRVSNDYKNSEIRKVLLKWLTKRN